jgi:hypothetical protein
MHDLGVLEVHVALKAGLVLRPRKDAGQKKKKEQRRLEQPHFHTRDCSGKPPSIQ